MAIPTYRKYCSTTHQKSSQCIALPAFQIQKNTVAKHDEKYPLCVIVKSLIKPAFDGGGISIFRVSKKRS